MRTAETKELDIWRFPTLGSPVVFRFSTGDNIDYTKCMGDSKMEADELKFGKWHQTNLNRAKFFANSCKDSIKYANGIYVAITWGYGVWWSEDGKDWHLTDTDGPNRGYWSSLEYEDGIWVIGNKRDGYGIWWSVDGKTWIQSEFNEYSSGNWSFISYGNGLWIAGEDYINRSKEDVKLWYSNNGKKWYKFESDNVNDVIWTCAKNVGETWLGGTIKHGLWKFNKETEKWEPFLHTILWDKTIWFIEYVNDFWIVGVYGYGILCGKDICGKDWVKCELDDKDVTIRSFAYGNGVSVVAPIFGGKLWYSKDNSEWHEVELYLCNSTPNRNRASIINTGWLFVKYINGIFIAGHSEKGLWKSKDGKKWYKMDVIKHIDKRKNIIKELDDLIEPWADVYYHNGLWLAGSYEMDGLWYCEEKK